ncbi:hypothetical protein ZIOFF_001338 [Zingiber officinale]|uniref:Amino acid transporter transmembrane domain-containing protein n=1 Tax=Zingiber officinale TaxID=94328 RepID=A0A8J5HV97_ZINOF|nr:hypothetical protein ZIOFF_001338 [Zingiber officinale]
MAATDLQVYWRPKDFGFVSLLQSFPHLSSYLQNAFDFFLFFLSFFGCGRILWGHNLALEIQASGLTMPQGGILNALYIYHSHDIPRGLLATTFLLVVFNCLNSFQIYSMPVFDSFEAGYTSRTNRPCSIWVRSGFRVFYGFISFFIGVALPFLSSLAGILGGLTLLQFVGIMESKTWIWNRKSTGKNIEKGKTLELEKSVENLNEQLSSVRSESNAKDDLLAKQAKVAKEAISGWEKAEAQALALQKQLDDALLQKKMAEERLVEQDTELQEFRQQLIY